MHTAQVHPQFGNYRIVERLGQGAFGTVYRANDPSGFDIAVKVLTGGGDSRLISRELEIGKTSISPHVVRVLDYDVTGQHPWLAMEYVEGRNLSELVGGRPMPEERAIHIAAQIAKGLEGLAGLDVIHRDLKPANVRVGAADSVKIIDLGLAKTMDGGATIAGTPAYMAPETVFGRSELASDVWSFGVVLAEMITGEAPLWLDEAQFDAVLRRVPARWRHVVRACLSPEPSRRPTAHQLVRMLDPEHVGARARPAGRNAPVVPPVPRPLPAVSVGYRPLPNGWYPAAVGRPRSARVALGLALVLGVYGGHRFYLGYHKEGAIQMFTAGGFFVWLIMDISDIVSGRMTDVSGTSLAGEASWQAVKPVLSTISALLGLVLLLGGVGLAVSDSPQAGAPSVIVGTLLLMPLLLLGRWLMAKPAGGRR